MTPLQELLAKVEAGDIPDTGVDRFRAVPKGGSGVYADRNHYNAQEAYWRGSLDAAKALHEAVLPFWDRSIHSNSGATISENDAGDFEASVAHPLKAESFEAVSLCMARAWLIAIIKALISQEVAA